jgi:hypothetical protein
MTQRTLSFTQLHWFRRGIFFDWSKVVGGEWPDGDILGLFKRKRSTVCGVLGGKIKFNFRNATENKVRTDYTGRDTEFSPLWEIKIYSSREIR